MRRTFADSYLPAVSAAEIYEKLADEESCEIFLWRYDYYKTRDHAKLYKDFFGTDTDGVVRYTKQRWNLCRTHQPGACIFPDIFDFLESRQTRTADVVIYGAGTMLKYCLTFLETLEYKIKAICDTYRHGKMFGKYSVLKPDEALRQCAGVPIFVTTVNETYQKEICQSLLAQDIAPERIFLQPTQSWTEKIQYFVSDIMKPLPNEVFIDAGCLDGGTIFAFIEFLSGIGYRRIYGFEPDAANFALTKKALFAKGVTDVTLWNKGLWDAAETRRFRNDGDCGTARIAQDGDDAIETVLLDYMVEPNDKVTLIKMDIEGAELNALRGASGIIRRDKPRLAICVYHKPEDIIEVRPTFVR